MALTDQRIAVRFPYAHLAVRGTTTTLYAPMYLNGALVAPTENPIVSIFDEGGALVVNAAAGTIADAISQYSLDGASTASLALAEGWRVEWTLTHTDGVIEATNTLHLVRRQLYPVICDADLYDEAPALNPAGQAPITRYTDMQVFRDAAWRAVNRHLIRKGHRPWLVLEPGGLAEAHTYRSIEGVYRDLVARGETAYAEEAERYAGLYRAALNELSLTYDFDDDELVDRDADGRPVKRSEPPVFLCSRS